ncbi:MAG: FKBP-type peptidyl-prolyl cis-trans isomerase, partial [Eubacterium sp.]|nr:FKBP-type peptidyl-prolyl cis-trans isomerase [Candidatus Colimonas fimequi]
MKIAVPFDNGNVFSHFGKAENFKIYNVENDAIVSAEVVPSVGGGHSRVADMLGEMGVEVVLCTTIGGAAVQALTRHEIEIFGGVEGNADEQVEAFITGEMETSESSCDGCGGGSGCGGGCGSDNGGGCGGCGHHRPSIEGPNVGKQVSVHYRGTFNTGEQFDSSYDRNEPLNFVCGAGQMIPGFDQAVANMAVGETVQIHLMPSEAYGERDPRAIMTTEIAKMPGTENLTVGEKVWLSNPYGQRFPAFVIEKTETTITFDANNEMAGKELNFT